MAQPPPQPPTGARPQQAPYPYPPYPYPYWPPPPKKDNTLLIIVIVLVVVIVVVPTVLAALLYVMVSGLISGPGTGPQSMGVTVSRSSDGVNWLLLVTSTPGAKAYTAMMLAIFRADGTTNLTATVWANLDLAGEGCSLQKGDPTSTSVRIGDRILCRVSWYATGSEYQISDGTTVLAAGRLLA